MGLLLCVSCTAIRNREYLMPLNTVGDQENSLSKNGYYYLENYVKTNPYYRNEYGGYSRDSTITYSQIRISTLALNSNGSAMKLGSYPGIKDNSSFNYGIKCNLEDNNTLESAFEHFECYIKKIDNKGLNFINAKAEIWNQGVYKISKNKISIQIFYNQFGNYDLYEQTGTILNDSTFVLTKTTDYQTNKSYGINRTYKFKRLDDFPKIDNYILKNKKKFNKNKAQ